MSVEWWNRTSELVLEYSLVKQFRLNGLFFIVSMKSTSMCTTWNKFHVHEWIFYPGHQGFKIFRFSKMLKKKLFFYSKSTKGYLISYKSKKKISELLTEVLVINNIQLLYQWLHITRRNEGQKVRAVMRYWNHNYIYFHISLFILITIWSLL